MALFKIGPSILAVIIFMASPIRYGNTPAASAAKKERFAIFASQIVPKRYRMAVPITMPRMDQSLCIRK